MSIEEARAFWAGARPEWSHLRGPMPDDRFGELGAANRARVLDLARKCGRAIPFGTIVEWGCGGGANAAAIVDHCDRYIGVDVQQSRGAALAEAAPGAEFVCVDMAEPEAAEAATASADLFFSSWCFTHFDSVEYGRRVLRVAANMLVQDGLLLVHAGVVDTDRPDESLPYESRWARACAWTTRGWLDDLKAAGFSPMRIQRDEFGLAWCTARKG